MQKIGAQYVMKKVYDQVLAPPKEAPPAEAEEVSVAQIGPDTIEVTDADGNTHTAYRVDAAVYAVTYGRGRPEAALARSIGDENAQVFVQREGGRVTGVIYLPDPNSEAPRGEAVRADDI